MSDLQSCTEASGSSMAIGGPDEADRLRRAIALMEAHATGLGPEVVDLVVAPLRRRLIALEGCDSGSDADTDDDRVGVRPLREVSVLFVDVVDSTILLRSLDAEDGHDVLDGALRRFGAAVHDEGGRVLRYTGDGLKAVFGLLAPARDDPVRAVRAGLEILRQARVHAVDVQRKYGLAGFALRAGIHTGPTTLGVEDAKSLIGTTVHLAACLEQNAPAGGLWISEDTWRAVQGRFEVRALDPLDVEGLDLPVPIYQVQRERVPG